MKLGRTRTLRGTVSVVGGVARKNIILSDGLLNFGLKITRFTVWPTRVFTGTESYAAILSLDTVSAGSDMLANDNRQFAWSFASTPMPATSIIDPDHIVNRDLFLTLDNSSTRDYNYLIECQVVELTDDEAIITIIKETSQS